MILLTSLRDNEASGSAVVLMLLMGMCATALPQLTHAQVIGVLPSVTITAPAQGSVISGTIDITADASSSQGISSVTFKIGARVIGEDATAPYSVVFDSTSVPNVEARAIHAVARDAAGRFATSTRVIGIANLEFASCTNGGITLAHGKSRVFYDAVSLPKGEACAAHGRTTTCSNGTLSTDQGWTPAYTYAVCTVQSGRVELDACASRLPDDLVGYWTCRGRFLVPWYHASTSESSSRIDMITHFPDQRRSLNNERDRILGILTPILGSLNDPSRSWTLEDIRGAVQQAAFTRSLTMFVPQVSGTIRADTGIALADSTLRAATAVQRAIDSLRTDGVPQSSLDPIQLLHDEAVARATVARTQLQSAARSLNSITPDGGDRERFSANVSIRSEALRDIVAARKAFTAIRQGPLKSARDAIAELSSDPAKACVQDGVTVADGRARQFYDIQIATAGTSCGARAQMRSCTDTVLSGSSSHRFASCTDVPTNNRVVRMHGRFFTELDPKETGRHSAPRYFTVEYSHPSDISSAEENIITSMANKLRTCGVSGSPEDLACILRPSSFSQDVIVTKTTIDVKNAPTDRFGVMGGDMCVSGVCLAAARVHSPTSDYSRSVAYPSGVGRFLKAREYLQAGTNLGVFVPNTLNPDNSEIRDASITFTFEYAPATPSDAAQKFVKIPYLDTVLTGPEFIPRNRPWYKPWSDSQPLVVRGIQTYGTNTRRSWPADSLCVMVIDANGVEVPGKKICLPPQPYVPNADSFGSEPIFVPGYIEVRGSERLSARCYKEGDTGPADCVLYPLIDIPADYVASYQSRIKFHPDIVDKDYLVNRYCPIDMKLVPGNGITFAGRREIQFVIDTELEPWKTLTANLPSDPSSALRKACEYLYEYPARRGADALPARDEAEAILGDDRDA